MKYVLVFTILFFSTNLFSQETLDISGSCNYVSTINNGRIRVQPASNKIVKMIDEIVNHIGLVRRFQIKEGTVGNAAAVMERDQRYIIYNANFLNKMINESSTYWSAVSIMAHEVAHHLNSHTLTRGAQGPTFELEADEFSGFVVHKMGGTLRQAQSAFNNQSMYQRYDSQTHPATSKRLKAIEKGWNKSNYESKHKDDHFGDETHGTGSSNFPSSKNSSTHTPNSSSREILSEEDIQSISVNLSGSNMEFRVTKDKRLLIVNSISVSSNGSQETNTSTVGNFVYYAEGGYYYCYITAINPTYGTTDYYIIAIDNNDIFITPYSNSSPNWTKIGKPKFNWGF